MSVPIMRAVKPVKRGWSKKRETWRWGLSFSCYFIWLSTYVALYILALQKLVMVGDNPFDYGQVAACVVSLSLCPSELVRSEFGDRKFAEDFGQQGTIGATITVLRCIVNESAYFNARQHTAKTNDFLTRLSLSVWDNKAFIEENMSHPDPLVQQSEEDSSPAGHGGMERRQDLPGQSQIQNFAFPPSDNSSTVHRAQPPQSSLYQEAQRDGLSHERGSSSRPHSALLDPDTIANARAARKYLERGRASEGMGSGNRSSTVSSERGPTAPLLGRRPSSP